MGIEHGRVCVTSKSALMAALFALGVMSVGWMVFVAALVAAEKLPAVAARSPPAVSRCCSQCSAMALAFVPRSCPA